MRALIALQHRFERTPDGAIWTYATFAYPFWQRYLDVFDAVRIVARVAEVRAPAGDVSRADGPGAAFADVPHFLGPWDFARKAGRVKRAVRAALGPDEAVILRLPGTVGTFLEAPLARAERPFGVEVVADPFDVFAPGGVQSVLSPILRWWLPKRLRRQCRRACAVAYVTEGALQQRYPAAVSAFTTHYSSVELPDEAYVAEPRRVVAPPAPLRLVLVGSLAQLYKGPDLAIDAVAELTRRGHDVRLTIVGDGKHRAELVERAKQRGLGERVALPGRLPAGAAVRTRLDEADLFILPSRTEGLPRAMIEAMARGLPCIGTRIGGFPELLPAEDLVPPGDAAELAELIETFARSPERWNRAAQRNLTRARDYHADVLRRRRRGFYTAVQDATAAWLGRS